MFIIELSCAGWLTDWPPLELHALPAAKLLVTVPQVCLDATSAIGMQQQSVQ